MRAEGVSPGSGRQAGRDRAHDRNRRVVHGRPARGPPDRPPGRVAVRAWGHRRVLERGEGGAGGSPRQADRRPRRGLRGGGARPGRRSPQALRIGCGRRCDGYRGPRRRHSREAGGHGIPVRSNHRRRTRARGNSPGRSARHTRAHYHRGAAPGAPAAHLELQQLSCFLGARGDPDRWSSPCAGSVGTGTSGTLPSRSSPHLRSQSRSPRGQKHPLVSSLLAWYSYAYVFQEIQGWLKIVRTTATRVAVGHCTLAKAYGRPYRLSRHP